MRFIGFTRHPQYDENIRTICGLPRGYCFFDFLPLIKNLVINIVDQLILRIELYHFFYRPPFGFQREGFTTVNDGTAIWVIIKLAVA